MPTQAIAIVGAGFSGTLLAVNLARKAKTSFTIHLIDKKGAFAAGRAYSATSSSHLLNVPAGKMSAFADEPNHFIDWISWNHGPVPSGEFVPRAWYGSYLRSLLSAAMTGNPLVSFHLHCDEAIDLREKGKGYLLKLKSGRTLRADKVILALGNPLPAPLLIPGEKEIEGRRYVSDPSRPIKFSRSERQKSILLVGTGLTMIDTALDLIDRGFEGTIHGVSRHGLIPQRHASPTPGEIRPLNLSEQKLRPLIRYLKENSSKGNWRMAIDSLRSSTPMLWSALSMREQQCFLRHARVYWDIHRHRIAPVIASRIDALLASKKLMLHAGRLFDYSEDSNQAVVKIRRRSDQQIETLSCAYVLNCTGPDYRYREEEFPLLKKMKQRGLIGASPLGLGIRTDTSGRILNNQGIASQSLYALGPLRVGDLLESTAVPELRVQAARLSELLQLEAALVVVSASGIASRVCIICPGTGRAVSREAQGKI